MQKAVQILLIISHKKYLHEIIEADCLLFYDSNKSDVLSLL